jgi:hypothetical protein
MDLTVRDLVAFPPGDNSSDTLIGGIHWNLTTLEQWNYQYYSNGTFSNGSLCFVVFEPYTPFLLPNGTFLNTTSCYSPIEPLGTRSKIGLAFACLFAASIMFTFINLRKHGKSYLPTEKRFRLIGRRWQWYWMLAVAAFAIISSITNVDVDRYYLSELPIVLSNFFWFLMMPSTLAVVWESVRHWGSWQERQMIDPNPFLLRQDDRRSKVELYLPLLFYFCFWMVSLSSLFMPPANQIELLHGRPSLMDPHRTPTITLTNHHNCRSKRNRRPLQACLPLSSFRLAHNSLLTPTLNQTLQAPQPRPPQSSHRIPQIRP